jgi:hypothetical protein
VAFQWLSDIGLDNGLFMEFISRSANRPLASIEASERLACQEMKLYYSLFKEWHFSGGSGNCVAEWHCGGQVEVQWLKLA